MVPIAATFNRGLNDDFIEALDDEYRKDGWWRALMDDKELFVAIRNNRVNVYYRGCSLAEVWMEAGTVVGRVHYKYLLRPSIDTPYVGLADQAYRLPIEARQLFVESPPSCAAEVRALKAAARPYAGGEKTGIQRIIDSNPNIMDVEIAFGMPGTKETDPSAPRVDFAALRVSDDGGELVFYEAKRFANHTALRAKNGKSLPKVVEQIDLYSQVLRDNRAKVVESYGQVCSNLLRLRGMRERHWERHGMLQRIAGKPLSIDPGAKLVVFGFDADQRDGSVWKPHRKRLFDLLGKERVLLRGNSKGFRRGISNEGARIGGSREVPWHCS